MCLTHPCPLGPFLSRLYPSVSTPSRLTESREGWGPAGLERRVGALGGRSRALSPSPVRPFDGRVGLDPKGLRKHVCWSGRTEARSSQDRESVAAPQPTALGAAMLGPGWEKSPAGNSGCAASRLLGSQTPRPPLVARCGTEGDGRGPGKAGRAPARGDAPPLWPGTASARLCACASASSRQGLVTPWPPPAVLFASTPAALACGGEAVPAPISFNLVQHHKIY